MGSRGAPPKRKSRGKGEAFPIDLDLTRLTPNKLLHELRERLRFADEMLATIPPTAANTLAACTEAMRAVFVFLEECRNLKAFEDLPTKALYIVAEIMDDTNAGLEHPLIRSRPSPKRRGRASTQTIKLRRYSVTAVNMLHDAGLSLKQAAEFVAKEFKAVGHTSNAGARRSGISAKTLLNWRADALGKYPSTDMKAVGQFVRDVFEGIDAKIASGEHLPMRLADAEMSARIIARWLAREQSLFTTVM